MFLFLFYTLYIPVYICRYIYVQGNIYIFHSRSKEIFNIKKIFSIFFFSITHISTPCFSFIFFYSIHIISPCLSFIFSIPVVHILYHLVYRLFFLIVNTRICEMEIFFLRCVCVCVRISQQEMDF